MSFRGAAVGGWPLVRLTLLALRRVSVTGVPFDLAEIKLGAPSIRPGTVAKEDVIARLSTAGVPFVTVVAPAGYGKTTLLARWAEADPRPFAWVMLDARDSDAVVFLRYIAAAIHRVEPVSPEVFDALSGPGGSTWAKRVPRVGGALAALERPLVLALDDLHLVANPSCLDVLAELVKYVPPARRSRSRAGRSRHCRLPAGGQTGRSTRSAWRTSGSTSRRLRCYWELPESSSMAASCLI